MFKSTSYGIDNELRRLREKLSKRKPSDVIDLFIEEIANLHAGNTILQDRIALLEDFIKSRDLIIAGKKENINEVESCALPDSLELDATWNLGSENSLYKLEYDDAGRAYRWNGPSNIFGFDVLIDRNQSKRGNLELLYTVDRRNFEDITIFIDGQKAIVTHDTFDDVFRVMFEVPTRFRAGLTYIRCHVPVQKSPANNTDGRVLGVAFHKISVNNSLY